MFRVESLNFSVITILRTTGPARPLCLLVLLLDDNSGTADSTSSSGGDETDLLTGTRITSYCRRLTNMLMVTTTVGMLDWILGDTSNLGPAVPLHSEFVVSSASLQHWLVDSSTAGDETKDCSVLAREQFLDTGWELHSCSASVWVVGYDGAVASRGLGNLAAVTSFLF